MKFLSPVYRLFFWPLVAAIVFTALLLYSRHVPPSFEGPVKGLSALITSLFALFGLKWDTNAKTADAHHLFRFRNILLLCSILALIIGLLVYEHQNRLTIRGIPGTAVYVDKDQYVGRIPTPDNAGAGIGMQEFRVPLRWGWRIIELKDNPLSPETVEEFREEIRFPLRWAVIRELWSTPRPGTFDASFVKLHVERASSAGRRGNKQQDRMITSRMTVAPLINFTDVDTSQASVSPAITPASAPSSGSAIDASARETCAVLSQKLNEFWVSAIGITHSGTGLNSATPSEMPALLAMKLAPAQPDPAAVVIHIIPQGRKTAQPLLSATLPAQPLSQETKSALQIALDRFLQSLPEVLSQRISDEDLVAWFTAYYQIVGRELGKSIQDALEDASFQRTAAVVSAFEDLSDRTIPTKASAVTTARALDFTRSLKTYPEIGANLKEKIEEVEESIEFAVQSAAIPDAPSSEDSPDAEVAGIPRFLEEDMVKTLSESLVEAGPILAKKLENSPPPPPSVVFLHCANEGQRGRLKEIQAVLESLTMPTSVAGIENIEGRARVPDVFEIRYFVNDAATKKRAADLLDEIKTSGELRRGANSRILFVFPGEFERRNTADLGNRFEIWPATDSFPDASNN
jgi:hypothetical protein